MIWIGRFLPPERRAGLETALRKNWVRALFLGQTAFVIILLGGDWLDHATRVDQTWRVGFDYQVLMRATERWLAGGPFYPPEQLAGPFDAFAGAILYPPVALVLFVPFTFLPALAWWILPILVTVAGIVRLRPGLAGWPLIVAGLLYHNSIWLVVSGNPVMFGVAALAWLGAGWPTTFFFLKVSLFPFAFLGARRRSWWVATLGLALVSLLLLPMWFDWLTVIGNAVSGRGLLYSLYDLPLLMAPLAAWVFRTRGEPELDVGVPAGAARQSLA
jgi:hypothetical protein